MTTQNESLFQIKTKLKKQVGNNLDSYSTGFTDLKYDS